MSSPVFYHYFKANQSLIRLSNAQHIADVFWFIDHLDLNLRARYRASGFSLEATMENAGKLRDFIWHDLRESSRLEKSHDYI